MTGLAGAWRASGALAVTLAVLVLGVCGEGFMGCYRDSRTRILKHMAKSSRDNMTLDVCRTQCDGYTYFGIENGKECYCGNSLNSPEKHAKVWATDCNIPCSGDRQVFCGGRWRISVFHVPVIELKNVALGKAAMQSSTKSGGGYTFSANKAVDGLVDEQKGVWTVFGARCMWTNNNGDNWLKIDLQSSYRIHSVKITQSQRKEHASLLGNATVNVDGTLCTTVPSVPAKGKLELPCSTPITGEQVTILLKNKELSLCELEVMAEPTPVQVRLANVALGKPAEQSSENGLNFLMPAGRAVDGNKGSNPHHGSCSNTGNGTNQWLRVDLEEKYVVHAVVITNRGDCCGERLHDFEVYVDAERTDPKAGQGALCVAVKSIAQGATMQYTCTKPTVGRYVSVLMPHQGYLTICELEVLGVKQ